MPVSTIGDLRQHILTSRNNTALKSELGTLVQELTSGKVSDLTSHLGSGQTNLAGVDRQLEMLGRFAQSNTETGQLLSAMQTALAGVDGHRATTSGALLTIDASSSMTQITNAGSIATYGFEASVQSLNMRFGDRAMFGGTDLDTNPLSDPADMLDALRLAVTGLTTAEDVGDAIDAWFDTPAGGFETTGYQGDALGQLSKPVDANQAVQIGVRADDQAIRDTLKALAKGALAGDATLALDSTNRQDLQRQGGVELLSAAVPLAGVQAQVGYVEGQVAEASVRITAQESSFGIARNDLVTADPFDTATRLQAVQLQLETHYTLTARLSRLSLTEYLR